MLTCNRCRYSCCTLLTPFQDLHDSTALATNPQQGEPTMDAPNLGQLARLPREIRDIVYNYMVYNITRALDYQPRFEETPMLQAIASCTLSQTNKQLFAEFVETHARQTDFTLPESHSHTLEDILDSIQKRTGMNFQFKQFGYSIIRSYFWAAHGSPSACRCLRLTTRETGHGLTRLWSFHDKYGFSARRVFADVPYGSVDWFVYFCIPERDGSRFLYRPIDLCKDTIRERDTLQVKIWVTDRDRSVKELDDAMDRLEALLDGFLDRMHHQLWRVDWTDARKLAAKNVLDSAVNIARTPSDFVDLRKLHMFMIDRTIEFWKRQTEGYGLEDLFKLAEPWAISEISYEPKVSQKKN